MTRRKARKVGSKFGRFAPSPASKETLSRLFRADNRVFRWFAPLYLERLSSAVHLPEDELEFARRVLEDLYRHAGKAPPPEFPSQPIEKLYNPGRRDWLEIVERTRKARVSYERDRATVTFSDDMLPYEIKRYENALPQAVKHRRQGRTLVIESPGEFRSWLEGSPKTALPLWRRLLGH